MIVLKFGGSSQSLDGYPKILERIRELSANQLVVVVSAIGSTTNDLFRRLRGDPTAIERIRSGHRRLVDRLELDSEPVEKLIDEIEELGQTIDRRPSAGPQKSIELLSYGEQLATTVLGQLFDREGLDSQTVAASHFIRANRRGAKIDPVNLTVDGGFYCDRERFDERCRSKLILTQGFIGSTTDHQLCLLGRSGSDTTAALIAASLKASCLEISTDVDGIYTADPRQIPEARLIDEIGYTEAEELSAQGSYVIHPHALRPCQRTGVPIVIRNTQTGVEGTRILDRSSKDENRIHAISFQSGISVFTIASTAMCQGEPLFETDNSAYGFVSQIYQQFTCHHVSVDIITTSEFEITTTTRDPSLEKLERLKGALERLGYEVGLVSGCATVTVVLDDARYHPKVPEAYAIAAEASPDEYFLTHTSSNRRSLSFVVSNEFGPRLLQRLHRQLLLSDERVDDPEAWWRGRVSRLLEVEQPTEGVYYYSRVKITEQLEKLKSLGSVNRIFYAMKANWHPEVIKLVWESGVGVETVSRAELIHLVTNVKAVDGRRVLFTPNFAPIEEYRTAFDFGCHVVIDRVELLEKHPTVFADRSIGVRVDCDLADGHGRKVLTEGEGSKFGLSLSRLVDLLSAARKIGTRIVGLHSHRGSGILDPGSWARTAEKLLTIADSFVLPDLKWLDLGGGLGIPSHGVSLDLSEVDRLLNGVEKRGVEFWLEPGRFIVAEAGVLLTKVTGLKTKGSKNYLGLGVGMNALVRPAMYGSTHAVFNLTRFAADDETEAYEVVGPICESGDKFASNWTMPRSETGDTILIEQAGAYGRAMSSTYNLREPPVEIFE